MSEPTRARMLYINPSEALHNRLKIFWTCRPPDRERRVADLTILTLPEPPDTI